MTNRESVLNIEDAETEDWDTGTIQTYYAIQQFSNACDYSNAKSVTKLFPKYSIFKNLETENVNKLKQQSEWKAFKTKILAQVLNEAYQKHENVNERLFFAAAIFDIDRLEEILRELKRQHESDYYREAINQMRNSDSVMVFSLKYGDLSKTTFLECMKILINEGIDTNKFDIKGKTAVDYVTLAYFKHKENVPLRDKLKQLAKLLVERRIYEEIDDRTKNVLEKDMELDLRQENYETMDDRAKLFFYIIKNNTKLFCEVAQIGKYLRIDNGEHTLLQFASKISDNRLPIVQFLLKNKADPNLSTEIDRRTPLELAAFANNQKVFLALLEHADTKIQEQQYNYLIRVCRPKLTQILLESKKLDPSFTNDKNGNSPLHYAILSSYQKATELLLKRGASLVKRNEEGKTPLAFISFEDLETYYDSCLVQDNYYTSLSRKYKMQFNFFKSIVDPNLQDELYIIYKIMKKKSLNPLLKHPLVQAFMYLKWYRMKNYFWATLLLQAFLFLAIGCSLNSSPNGVSTAECFFFTVNALLKLFVFFNCRRKEEKRCDFFVLREAKAHASVEISVILTHIFSFFDLQFRAFIFTEMAVCFLLTAGYHPRLSKWSLMLQRVFKTFTMLLIFFSLVVFTYGLGFHLLCYKDGHMFQNFSSAVLKTYIMTAGEFNVEEIESEGATGYFLILIFTLTMSLVIVNFWTGVAVTDIENIQRHSEINACKNVLAFMKFVDYIYGSRGFKVFRRFFGKPFLFLHLDGDSVVYQDVKKCRVDFFINKNRRQFGDAQDFPSRLDEDCLDKVKKFCYETKKSSDEQDVRTRLKMLDDVLKNEREILFKLKEMEQALKTITGVRSKQVQTPTGSLKDKKNTLTGTKNHTL